MANKMELTRNKTNILSGLAERDLKLRTFNWYIGIDPDIHKTGYALYKKRDKALRECDCYAFFDLLDYLQMQKALFNRDKQTFIVHIEGAWLDKKSNWHDEQGQRKGIGELIAKNVGSNHQVGLLIVEMCIYLDISFMVRMPITPRFNSTAFFKKVTKWTGATNKDSRSAANYVFGF